MTGGGAFGALVVVIGVLIGFALLFSTFLIVPFFIFLAGIVVMLVSDRKRGSGSGGNGNAEKDRTVEVVETTETREARR